MNYYEILGVKKDASQKEIKDAYKKLIKKYHPDIYPGDKHFAEKKTQELNSAYDVLSNKDSRLAYDEEIFPSSSLTNTKTYTYTPPKYENPESYSYQNYYKKSYSNNSDFETFKRYSDYHRSKTPNSNYTTKNNIHSEFTNNIMNSVGKMNTTKKIGVLLFIIFIYLILFITSFLQFNSVYNGKNSGALLDEHTNSNSDVIFTTHSNTNSNTTNSKEDFDINDYFSERELREIYNEYYSNTISSYSEFRKLLSDYIYYNFDV